MSRPAVGMGVVLVLDEDELRTAKAPPREALESWSPHMSEVKYDEMFVNCVLARLSKTDMFTESRSAEAGTKRERRKERREERREER